MKPSTQQRLNAAPTSWLAYKAHLRRGGFGSDLKTPKVARDVTRLAKSFEDGHSVPRTTRFGGGMK